MKRWRTNGAAGRCLVVAALAILLAAGWLHEVRAEPNAPNAPTFSRAALEQIGDYVRNEVTTGKVPGAVLLIQQHGKPVYLQSFGVRDPATGQPMTPDTIFQTADERPIPAKVMARMRSVSFSAALARTRKYVAFDELLVSGKHHVARAAFAAKARLIHPVEWDADLAALQDIPNVAVLRGLLDGALNQRLGTTQEALAVL